MLLTLGMAVDQPDLWLAMRFLAGVVSALVFVLTAGWTMARLAERGWTSLGGTYLPVIAGAALPRSLWLAMFWSIFGLAAAAGCLLAIRTPAKRDPRWLLIGAYLCQAVGVVFALPFPSVTGFAIDSLLVGLPFTAINFWPMQEVRRQRPHHAARYMGLLTALYGIGQIAGPPMVAWLLAMVRNSHTGFALSLCTAWARSFSAPLSTPS